MPPKRVIGVLLAICALAIVGVRIGFLTGTLTLEWPAAIGGEFPPDCRSLKIDSAGELCAQWRAAWAAERSAWWAALSFWIGVGGLLGLFLTLHYTRHAVAAARESAEGAEETAQHARESAEASRQQVEVARGSQRAYLVIQGHRNNMEDWVAGEEPQLTWYFDVHNAGRTPAFDVEVRTLLYIPHTEIGQFENSPYQASHIGFFPKLMVRELSHPSFLLVPERSEVFVERSGPPLMNFEEAPYRKMVAALARERAGVIWFRVVVGYVDAWGNDRLTENLFTTEPRLDGPRGWNVRQAGGTAYNRRI